jgi:hypothetical protein
MKCSIYASFLAVVALGIADFARADETDAKAIVAKAIKAMGGEERLAKAMTHTSQAKGRITIEGNDHEIKIHATVRKLDHIRSEFELDFDGNQLKFVMGLNGDKAWRKFGDGPVDMMDQDALADEKRTIYLAVVPVTLIPLNGTSFKVERAGDEKVGDKPAVGIKVTAPDGKDFVLYFDKETGLPARLVAKVFDLRHEEYTQQTTYSNYKELDGIKKAMKLEMKRDGQKFIEQEITEFKVLDKVPADAFDEPK